MRLTLDEFDAPGFTLGHQTCSIGKSGCSVLIADRLSPAAVEVRGGAPGTRETDLLGPGRSVQGVDAILLTGGSAFGLGAADGVMEWLFEHGRGFETSVVNVPIVAGAVIFDLEKPELWWPRAYDGYQAAASAEKTFRGGRLGGGTGASVSKVLGRDQAVPSGIGICQVESDAGSVSAVIVNNAFGDIFDDKGGRFLTTPGNGSSSTEDLLFQQSLDPASGENTVIGAITVSRPLDHDALTRIAVSGHAGISRVVRPSSCPTDGDTIFAIASDEGRCSGADLMQLTAAAQIAVSRALISAVDETRGDR
jgi:L-aminopeptidase/D-esterase-like protein